MGNSVTSFCESAKDDKIAEVNVETTAQTTEYTQPQTEAPVDVADGEAYKATDEPGAAADAYKATDVAKDVYEAAAKPIVVVFEHKGVQKAVEFVATTDLGFDYVQAGGWCCGGGKAKALVKVKKIVAKQQAANNGISQGDVIKLVNGQAIADADQLRDAIAGVMLLGAKAPATPKPQTTLAPAADQEPKAEEFKAEEPKAEEPKAEEPKAEQLKAEEPQAEEQKAEEPKAEELKAEEPKAEYAKAEEPKPEEKKAEEPKAAEAKAEELKEEKPKTEEPTVVEAK